METSLDTQPIIWPVVRVTSLRSSNQYTIEKNPNNNNIYVCKYGALSGVYCGQYTFYNVQVDLYTFVNELPDYNLNFEIY
jgi:hypothetical protein